MDPQGAIPIIDARPGETVTLAEHKALDALVSASLRGTTMEGLTSISRDEVIGVILRSRKRSQLDQKDIR